MKRLIKKPMDCVINALQVLGLVDEKHADLMRILVGDTGPNLKKISAALFLCFLQNIRFLKITHQQLEASFSRCGWAGMPSRQTLPRAGATRSSASFLPTNRAASVTTG
jgi:hypothetical protein